VLRRIEKPATLSARGFFIVCVSLCLLFLVGCTSQPATQDANPSRANAVVFSAMQQAGRPYRYGGSSPQTGFDCSGLIYYAYQNAAGLAVPRTVKSLYAAPYPNIANHQLQGGDVVIFSTNRGNKPDHAGIYVGEQRFVHAPSTGGTVRIDTLDSSYWKSRFLTGKRVLIQR